MSDLERVELKLRQIIEARLERGETLNPIRYGIFRIKNRILARNDDCEACLLGSVVLKELERRPVKCNDEIWAIASVAGDILNIPEECATELEAGFMHWGHPTQRTTAMLPWWRLGRQLCEDYYESEWTEDYHQSEKT